MENDNSGLNKFVKNWWIFSLVGILLIISGIWVWTETDADSVGLTRVFIFLFLGNGALEIFFAVTNRRVVPSWGGILVLGIFQVLLGILFVISPPDHINIFSGYVGIWLLSRGMLLFLTAVDLDALGFSPDWMLYVIGGVLTTGMGLGVFLQPKVGFGTLVVWTALGMILAGAFFVLFSLNLRKTSSRIVVIEQKLKDINRIAE